MKALPLSPELNELLAALKAAHEALPGGVTSLLHIAQMAEKAVKDQFRDEELEYVRQMWFHDHAADTVESGPRDAAACRAAEFMVPRRAQLRFCTALVKFLRHYSVEQSATEAADSLAFIDAIRSRVKKARGT